MSLIIRRLYKNLMKYADEPKVTDPVQLNILPTNQDIKDLVNNILNSQHRETIIQNINKIVLNHSNDPFVQNHAADLAEKITQTDFAPVAIMINFCNNLKGFFNPNIFCTYLVKKHEYTYLIELLKANITGINPNDYLKWIIDEISNHSGLNIRYTIKDIITISNINYQLLEEICLKTNNIDVLWAYGVIIPNINVIAIQDKMIELSNNGGNFNKLIEFTARKYKDGAKILPIIDVILSKDKNGLQYNTESNNLKFLLQTIIDNGGKISNEIIDYVLDKLPIVICQLMANYKTISNANYIIDYFINHNNYQPTCMIEMLDANLITDLQNITKYVVHFKDVKLARVLLTTYSDIVGNNFIFLQNFIEKNGTLIDLEKLTNPSNEEIPKLNFASLKKRYNVLEGKYIEKNPENITVRRNIVEYAISTNYGGGSDIIPAKDIVFEMYNLLPSYEEKFLKAGEFTTKYTNEVKDLLQEIINKKDWFCLNASYIKKLLSNPYIIAYKIAKNKTLVDMYNEVFKNNYELMMSAWISYRTSANDYYVEFNELTKNNPFILQCINASTNFGEYVKLLSKAARALELIHNSGINPIIIKLAVLNKGFDIKDASNTDFLEIAEELDYFFLPTEQGSNIEDIIRNKRHSFYGAVDRINDKVKKVIINPEEFEKNLNIVVNIINSFKSGQPISWKRGSQEYEALKKLHMDLNVIKNFETIQEYMQDSKPKHEKLKDLTITLPGGFDFKVLGYLDPYAFKIGADTDCCQRIGGVGEQAAIDSFVNPMASVLALYKDNNLLSQSYFHYVPEQNGLILDNVEVNNRGLRLVGLTETTLSKIYADYAQAIKLKNPELAYVKCGLGYNKIDNNLFGKSTMTEDPRYFAVDDPYSDFDEEEHLDLLKPIEELKSIQVAKNNTTASINTKYLLKTSMIRQLMLTNFFKN